MTFRLEMLPACEGDCLILSWGEGGDVRRILIDAGRRATAKAVRAYVARHDLGPGAFERFIITHIDRDHIEGAVALLRDPDFAPLVGQVWFNGRGDMDYAPPASKFEEFGALDGERLSNLIRKHGIAWNKDFDGVPVAVLDDTLPTIRLPGDLSLTLLSPDLDQLKALARPWDETVAAARPGWEEMGEAEPIDLAPLLAVPFASDRAKPNGSSIAFVAEYHGRRALLTGDAHASRLLSSLELYRAASGWDGGFSLVKASHHGSRGNVSTELVRAVNCPLWAISTNGAQFGHPDREAIARIIDGSPGTPTLWFNYRTAQTRFWAPPLKSGRAFSPLFGEEGYAAIDIG